MNRLFGFSIIIFLLQFNSPGKVWAQNPVANFNIPTSACLGEEVVSVNGSTGSSTYLWDFCASDLSNATSASLATTISTSLTPTSITMVYDQGNWYGFMSSRDNGKLFRIDFGNSLENPSPLVTDLGNVGSVFSGPKTTRFVQESGNWYAIGINNAGSTMFRLSFGTSLANNTPTGVNLGDLGTGANAEGLDLVFDGTNWIAAVASYSSNKVSLVKFGNSILNNPSPATDVLTILNMTQAYGIKLFNDAGQWYGLAGSYSVKKITRMKFGATLFSVPTTDDIYNLPVQPTALSIQKEGNDYYAFIATLGGSVHRLFFGNTLNNNSITSLDLGNFGLLSATEGFDLVRSTPLWYGFFVNYSAKTIHRLKFQKNCPGIPLQSSTLQTPSITYSQAGTYFTELTAYSSNGNADTQQKSITIQNQTAPDIDFSVNGQCLGVPSSFTAVSVAGGIQDYTWAFGDGATSTINPANYTYTTTGNYNATLTINGTNGCKNTATKAVSIFNPPVPNFSLPTGTICTNQSLLFTNTSSFDVGSNPTWNWFVEGALTASTTDLNHAFSTVAPYNIKLVASISGCQNEITKTLNSLSAGPSVDFSYTNNCYLQAIQFTNLTTGAGISGQTWVFGDGNSASSINASHTFSTAGNYNVNLTVTNGAGCANSKVVTIPVNDQPLIDFTYTNATQNIPATYTGQDLTLADDVVTNWMWDFNGIGSANTNPATFAFSTPATYPVKLSVTTQQGCSFMVQKSVVVQAATKPNTSFTMGSSGCLNEQVSIINTTVNGVNYMWDFCASDLSNATSASLATTISTSLTPTSITMVYDQGNWYGFMSSRDNGKLFRIDFGNSLENPSPLVTDLGNVSSVFSGPKTTRFVQESGNWYAIGINNAGSTMFRLSFGTSLANNTPTGVNLGDLGTGANAEGLDLVFDGTNWIAAVASYSSNKVSLVKFGNSILNNPSPATDVLTILNMTQAYGIKLFNDAGQWYGLAGSYSVKKITRMKFGATLFSVPTTDDIYNLPVQPTALSIQKEGNDYYAFIATLGGSVHRLFFGNTLNNNSITSLDLGNFGLLSATEGFDLVRSTPVWYGFFVNYSAKTIHRLKFQKNCPGIPLQSSTLQTPSITYSQAGTYFTELTAYSSNGNADTQQKAITIQNQTAPDIDFSVNGQCLGVPSSFTAVSVAGGIQDYTWAFGDGATSTINPANYTYTTTGNYNATLTINGTNGCKNTATKAVSIFNPPVPNFSLPTGTICTNQSLLFTNTSSFDVGSNPTWNWFVEGALTASTTDLNQAFSTVAPYNIKLVAGISGCQNEITKTLNSLSAGPSVDFSYTNNCYLQAIQFTNLTTGAGISGQTWVFGDGNSASSINASHTFSTAGNYNVNLTVTNGAGCANSKVVTIPVNDQPLIDFTYTNATQNIPATYTGQDLTLADDVVTNWMWDFNGIGSANTNPATFAFSTPATYLVKLSVTTQQGCSFMVQKSVVVQAATKPNTSFTMGSSGCLNEQVSIINTTVNGVNYMWDFCASDLSNATSASLATTISTSLNPTSITMVYDQGNWYGFMSSRDNGKLFRIDFGNSLENPSPLVTDLGNVSSVFSGPKTTRFVQESGNWYAIGINNAGSTMFRLSFGTSLANNTPTGVNLGDLGTGANAEGLDLVFDGTNWIAAVASYSSNKVSLVKFGNSILNNPSPATDVLTILNMTQAYGIKLFNDAGQWYGLAGSYSVKKITRMKFGATLFSVPTTDDIYNLPVQPTALSIQKEGNDYYAFIATLGGSVHRLFFGNTLNNNSITSLDLGNFGLLSATEGFDLVRSTPLWYGFFVNYSAKTIHRLKFQKNCPGIPLQSSTLQTPSITYSQAGTYFTELTAYSSNGNADTQQKAITIQNQTAPDIDFSVNGQCLGVPSSFTAVSVAGGIQDYTWAFGDGATSTINPANYTYTTTGNYNATLTINGTNGCKNAVTKAISIFNPPVPNFLLPTNNPLCTNQQFTFTNTSTSDIGSTPTWEWLVDEVSVSTTKDLLYSFSSATGPVIKLKASIPGCTNELSQTLTSLLAGPQVNFTISGFCENDPLTFTNTTTDPVTGYLWDFDDGQTSTSTNTQVLHSYSMRGTYNVSLQGNSINGCQNITTKTITIYTKPQPDFSLSLPPFSCSGSSSQFNDLTPNPVDSNISEWLWDFNDVNSSQNSSSDQNPQHIYANGGSYNVSLTTTTDFGCSTTIKKSIDIAQSPKADFTNTPACKDQTVNFTDASDNSVATWSWQIENTFYYFKNPSHLFTSVGSYPVELVVTGNNNCISVINKILTIPQPLTPDFTFQKNCAGQRAEFNDLTNDAPDAIVKQSWTFGNIGTGSGSPTTFTFMQTGNYNVQMNVTAQSGCIYSISKNVNILSSPVADFKAIPEVGIPPLNVQFTNTSTNATTFSWAFHDSKNSTSSNATPSFTFQDPGEYVIDMTASNSIGCSNTISKMVKAILPIYDINLTSLTTVKNSDGSIKILATLKNDGNLTLENIPIILDLSGFTSIRESIAEPIAANTAYSFVFSNEITNPSKINFLCADVELENDNLIENNRKCTSLNAGSFVYEPYPNPTDDELSIDWITNDKDELLLKLVDPLGKQVLLEKLESAPGLNSFKIQTDALNNGLYILQLSTGTLKTVKKIAISH